MKRFVWAIVCLVAALAACGVVARTYQQLPPPAPLSPGTIEVSAKTALTSNSEYDRNPAICYDGAGLYWLFYTKGDNTSTGGVRGVGYDPDSDTYVVYYKYASTVAGLESATEKKLANSESTRPAGFDQRVVTAAMIGNDIYAIVSSGQSGTNKQMYYYKRTLYPTAGAWSSATLLTSDTGGHVNAVSDGSTIYIVWESSDGSSDSYTFDGTTLSAKSDISTDNQPKITLKGSTLYAVSIEDGTGDIEVRSTPKASISWGWHSTAITGGGFYDPSIFSDGTDLYVVMAPYVSVTDQQYLVQTKYSGGSWAAAKKVSLGGYGAAFWWDYWPVGFNDGGNLWLFFTTETSSPAYSDGEIAAVKMDWDLANDHYFYIQNAVDQAVAGDTINVAAGTYNENVTVNKALTLLGAQAGVDARGRSADESVLTAASGNVLYVKTAGITVDGFQLSGAGAAKVVFADTCGGLQFENSILDGTAVSLLYFGTTSPDVAISRNEFDGASVTGYLLFFDGGSDAYNNLTIRENNFAAGEVFAGGKTFNSSNMLMVGNLFDGADANLSSHFKNSTIRGNTFRSNTYTNAQVGLKDSCICDNIFEAAGPSPSPGYPSYALMLWGNQYGLTPSQNVTIEGNTFYYDGTAAPGELAHGVRILSGIDATTISLAYNAFRDEGRQAGAFAIVNQGTGMTVAENNWWGTLTGGVISGMVSGSVDTDPYLWTSQIHVAWAGARLVETQNNDGGWDWPLDDGNPDAGSAANTIAPIGMGLAKAYRATGDAAMYAALQSVANYLQGKTYFSPSDGYLAAELDSILGVTTNVDHVRSNFYDMLAAGTYYRSPTDGPYTTAQYVQWIRTTRASQGLPNLAAWDVGMGLVGAAACGADTTEWVVGTKAEIDELDAGAGDGCEVIGLAGAMYGLACAGEDYDPSSGMVASASSLGGMATLLVSNGQMSSGAFSYLWGDLAEGNEDNQVTAYAVLAFAKVGGNRAAVVDAIEYLERIQICTGGWAAAVGYGEYNEVNAETVWGLSVGNLLELNVQPASVYVKPSETVTIDMDVSNLLQKVNGCQAILNFDSTYFGTGTGDVSVVPGGGTSVWDLVIWDVWDISGDLDTAIGVNAQGSVGTQVDATVCKITLTPTGTQGTTQMIFRSDVGDLESTWLSDMSASAVTPNKMDSQTIVIDGTAPSVTVTSPDGGEFLQGGGSWTITWSASDPYMDYSSVALDYSPDNGGSWISIATGQDNDGSYDWGSVASVDTDTALVRVTVSDLAGNPGSDTSDAVFTIDSTTPDVDNIKLTVAADGSGTDLTPSGTAIQGTYYVSLYVSDDDTGVDSGIDWSVLPTIAVTDSASTSLVTGSVTADPGNSAFTVQIAVTASSANGTADIEVSGVKDKAGNEAAAAADTFNIDKNQITGTVEMDTELTSSAYEFDRNVVFKATDGGGTVLKTWTVSVHFVNNTGTKTASGTYTLTNVPGTTANLSAKTAWSLREKKAAALVDGQATVDFTGSDKLRGGDLNGSNTINILDYSILKINWFTHMDVADINGNGDVSSTDYSIMKMYWFTMGDPE